MAQVLQAEGRPRREPRKLPAAAVLTALGVVYGDIGTSTLYGLKQAIDAGGTPTPETVMGTVSLIFWALLLIVGLKYAILILRADNRGEGGIVALLALLDVRHAPHGSARASLLVVGLIGAALLYGDGGAQRRRRPEDRCARSGADGRSHHHCDPGRPVSGAAKGNGVRGHHLWA